MQSDPSAILFAPHFLNGIVIKAKNEFFYLTYNQFPGV